MGALVVGILADSIGDAKSASWINSNRSCVGGAAKLVLFFVGEGEDEKTAREGLVSSCSVNHLGMHDTGSAHAVCSFHLNLSEKDKNVK